jgi:hypothetical protein
MSQRSNGTSTLNGTVLDPQLIRLIDERILLMRKVLEERLSARLDDHMKTIHARLDQFFVDVEDRLDEDDEDDDEEPDDPFDHERKRRR